MEGTLPLTPLLPLPGKIEFTWQEVMIGLESSLLMFPINLLIVQIFRNTHPRITREQNNGKWDARPLSLAPSPQPVEDGLLTPEAVTKAGPQPRQCGGALGWAEVGVGTGVWGLQPMLSDSISHQDLSTAYTHIHTHVHTPINMYTHTRANTHMYTSAQ